MVCPLADFSRNQIHEVSENVLFCDPISSLLTVDSDSALGLSDEEGSISSFSDVDVNVAVEEDGFEGSIVVLNIVNILLSCPRICKNISLHDLCGRNSNFLIDFS